MSDLRGQVTFTNNFGGVIADILGNVVHGQNLAGERLLELAVDRAPMDNGDLIGSGQVVNAEQPGDPTQVVFDRPQAARLHEHPEYNFSKDSNPNAQGKYLEGAAIDNKTELGDIVRKEARSA